MRMLKTLFSITLISLSLPLFAQDLSTLRGGWVSDVNGQRHVLYLVLRDNKVSGMHCSDCYDPDNLAFVDDGKLDASGLHFNLYHSSSTAASYIQQVDAQLQNGLLHLTLKKPGSEASTMVMHKEVIEDVAPAPVNVRTNVPGNGQTRMLPGTAEIITPEKVLGLWLWGIGPGKQYFMFKAHKDGMRGMVCGPCLNAKDFAPLENISMNGTNFHFDIVHEDNGGGFEEHGPFNNITDAVISMHEFHMTTYPSFDPAGRTIEMSLLGPVQFK